MAQGENVLKSVEFGIHQDTGNTVIQGDGELTVTAEYIAIYSDALTITGDVKVNAAALNEVCPHLMVLGQMEP